MTARESHNSRSRPTTRTSGCRPTGSTRHAGRRGVPVAESPNVFLSHGASGSAATMRPWVTAVERAGQGLRAATVPADGKLPMRVERAMEIYLTAIAESERPVIGGVSYGGRVASMVAAGGAALSGLVLLSYPLHPPGKTDQQRVD